MYEIKRLKPKPVIEWDKELEKQLAKQIIEDIDKRIIAALGKELEDEERL